MTIDYIDEEKEFTKKWYTQFDICQNPTCACRNITIELYDIDQKEKEPERRISFDLLKQKAVMPEGKNKSSTEDFQLAELIAYDFSKENWIHLQKIFFNYKKKLINSTPIDQLNYSFPMKKIERDGLMIGYYEIFPHAEKLWLELNNVHYLLDDQYCLRSTCKCTHTMLTIIALRDDQNALKANDLVLMFDYNTKAFEIAAPGYENIAKPKVLVKEIMRIGLSKIFKARHIKLRSIYKHFRKKKQKSLKKRKSPALSIIKKRTGRNDPCPCGSGKKIKQCCLQSISLGKNKRNR